MAFATRLEKRDLEDLVRPKLKLFLSVDVVGSTAFKQSQPRNGHGGGRNSGGPANWLTFLSSFYRDFGNRIRLHLGRLLEHTGLTDGNSDERVGTPHLWKALGDELVFVIELKHENHLPVILDAFRHAINEEIDLAKAGDHPLPISLKGSAWLAGFPVCNAEIPMVSDLPSGPDAGAVTGFDYAGPAIDIGFRISKLASPHRLIVSAEVAYLLTIAGRGGEIVHHLHPDRPAELKGILGGEEYPVFWIDCFREVNREPWLERIKNTSHTADQEGFYAGQDALSPQAKREDIRKFLEAWFERHSKVLMKPFVPRDASLKLLPSSYWEKLELVQAELRDLYRGDEEDQGNGDPTANQLIEDGADKVR